MADDFPGTTLPLGDEIVVGDHEWFGEIKIRSTVGDEGEFEFEAVRRNDTPNLQVYSFPHSRPVPSIRITREAGERPRQFVEVGQNPGPDAVFGGGTVRVHHRGSRFLYYYARPGVHRGHAYSAPPGAVAGDQVEYYYCSSSLTFGGIAWGHIEHHFDGVPHVLVEWRWDFAAGTGDPFEEILLAPEVEPPPGVNPGLFFGEVYGWWDAWGDLEKKEEIRYPGLSSPPMEEHDAEDEESNSLLDLLSAAGDLVEAVQDIGVAAVDIARQGAVWSGVKAGFTPSTVYAPTHELADIQWYLAFENPGVVIWPAEPPEGARASLRRENWQPVIRDWVQEYGYPAVKRAIMSATTAPWLREWKGEEVEDDTGRTD